MADKKVKFVLDLDNANFNKQAEQSKSAISAIGNKENIAGLIDGLAVTGVALGSVAAAGWLFKEAINLTEEAEQIKRVEKQFETLTAAAGISAKTLKEGMEKASGGLITTGDLLQIANKAIVAMGSSAQKLPEIMELARKATAVFGGDLKNNFENISTAIANGNTRLLKQYGLVIDSEKAIKDFAAANNIAVNSLTEGAKRQALMNAALEQSKKAYAGVHDDLNSTQNTLTLLKNTVAETAEVFTLAFDKTMGPTIRKFLGGVSEMASDARQKLTAMFGEGLEANNAKIAETENKLRDLKGALVDLEVGKEPGFFSKLIFGGKEDQAAKLNSQIAETTAKLAALREETARLSAEEKERPGADPDKKLADQLRVLENENKFQMQMQNIKRAAFEFEAQNIQNLEQIDALADQKKIFAKEEYLEKIKQIAHNENLIQSQKNQLIGQETHKYHQQMQVLEAQTADLRKKLLDQYVKNSTTAFNGIANAFKAGALKSKSDLADFGRFGQETFNSFERHASFAFAKMGEDMVKGKDIAKSATDAMAGFFLNMIADRAIGEGSLMLLSSVWPPNPIGLAAGAGLMALGGALRTLAGGSGSSIGGAVGGGAGMTGPGYGVSTEETKPYTTESTQSLAVAPITPELGQTEMQQMERKQRSVSVNIAGNYFDTEASRRQLMEMIRQESDATDFTYNKIGAN